MRPIDRLHGEVDIEAAGRNIAKVASMVPELAVTIRNCALGSTDYEKALINKLIAGRREKRPLPPETTRDETVSLVLEAYFGESVETLDEIHRTHGLSMAAENIVGDLLERYIAQTLEPFRWIWCAGNVIKSVDFIHPPNDKNGDWILLQVKNRDNSENSSSSKIRIGTKILKWHRSFSKKLGTNWKNFPCELNQGKLSEEGFQEFARRYLKKVRSRN